MEVGSKVVCINAKKDEVSVAFFPSWIEEGQTYTIRRKEGSVNQGTRVLLDEVSNPPVFVEELGGKIEPGFSIKRFVSYEEYILSNAIYNEEECEA